MTTAIEQRVVQMKFDNAAFQREVANTLKSLQSLEKGLQLAEGTKGLSNIGAAAKEQRDSLKNVETSVQSIADRFKAMGVVATTALVTVSHQAVTAAGRIIKSFTLGPILEGFQEYETNLNSIQTIMANTGLEGKKGLKTVTNALDELNHYSDQTIYNFSEMARNIGTFTAAGVDLDTATAAIKGIANLAAISGSNSQQASTAMYQLSQAISAGRATLEDWNSVVNAGMGGKVFQNALMETARVHGIAIDDMVKKAGSFRLTLQEGWLTGEILTETLSKFTGDLTASQLKTMGYNEEQIKGILKMGKTAQDAATKVKTMTQLMSTLREGLTSGWAKTWQMIFGDFNEARNLFTDVGTILGGFVDRSSEARNKVINDWKELGGRAVLIDAISNSFNALMDNFAPIRDAFRDIFPAKTGKQLFDLTVMFKNFTETLKMGGESATNLRRTFAGIFAIFDIGFMIIGEFVKLIFDLIGVTLEGSGGFLEFTGNIGDFLVNLRNAIKEGKGLESIFSGIGAVLAVPIKLVQKLGEFLAMLFKDVDGTKTAEAVKTVSKQLEPVADIGEAAALALEWTYEIISKIVYFIQNMGSIFRDFFHSIGIDIAAVVQSLDFTQILAGFATGVVAYIALIFDKLIGGQGLVGMMDDVGDAVENFAGVLGAMQNTLRAATLLQIAIAIGILAISMNTLSKIDAAGLTRAGVAITVMFTQLIGALLIFEKLSGFVGFAKMPIVAASMILLGIAINILAMAVKKLASLSWEELAKGLIGTTVLLSALIATVRLMPNPAGMISTSAGLVILALAIRLLAGSVSDLSTLSWEEMAQGLVGVGSLLASLALFTKFAAANKGGLIQSAGILILAVAIKLLASAIDDFASMSWEELGKGATALTGSLALIIAALAIPLKQSFDSVIKLLVITAALKTISTTLVEVGKLGWDVILKGLTSFATSLLIIIGALLLVPKNAMIGALSILAVAGAIALIGDVLQNFGKMGWEEIAKALILLAGSLAIIAGALFIMPGALPGAAALLVVAGALTVLAPVVQAFSKMSWGEIVAGLVMLAGVFAVIGVAALLLTPIIPSIMGLAVAILTLGGGLALFGAGIALAGTGILFMATALVILATAGSGATVAIVAMVSSLASLFPMLMEQWAVGIMAFIRTMARSAPELVASGVAIIGSMIAAMEKLIPKIVTMLLKLLTELLESANKYIPRMVKAGLELIAGLLEGIGNNIGRITTAAINILTNFIDSIAKGLPKIIQSGFNLIISFIEGLTKAINENSERLGKAGGDLAVAMVKGMANGLLGGIGQIWEAAENLAATALNSVKEFLGIASPSKEFEKIGKFVNQGFVKGLLGSRDDVNKAFVDLREMLREATRSAIEDAERAEAKLKRLTSAREKDAAAIKKATAELAQANKEAKLSSAAYTELTKKLNDERLALGKLANQYEVLSERIKNAQNTLADAKRTRDDYYKSIKDQYSSLPEIEADTKLDDYFANLEKKIEETKEFASALQRLRLMGLNDTMYKELLERGPEAMPFITQLLAGGRASVNEINQLGAQLASVANSLGRTVSNELYQAAVDSAAGFLKGLQNQQKAIEKQMEKLADAMVKALKKKLGIKSPSVIFAELGAFAAKGLVEGLLKTSGLVEQSAENLGLMAVESMKKSIAKIANVALENINTNPTITPVLDLTPLQKSAGQIEDMIPTTTISLDATYSQAKNASNAYATNSIEPEEALADRGSSVVFNQYNTSPKALSQAEIYRQTKNQISIARGALATK